MSHSGRIGLLALILLFLHGAAGGTPKHRETLLLAPLGRGIGAGDTVLVQTRWDSAGYQVTANFAPLDGAGGGPVMASDLSNGYYRISYVTGSMAGLSDSPGVVIPVNAMSRFDSSAATYLRFTVCRNASTPRPEHLRSFLRDGGRRIYAGDSLIVRTIWQAAGVRSLRVAADLRSLVPRFQESALTVREIGADGAGADTFEIAYDLPGKSDLVPEANGIPLTIIGRDSLCSDVRFSELLIDLRTSGPPAPVSQRILFPIDRGVRDLDTLRIESRWDSAGYFVRADFTELDGGTGGLASALDEGGGLYTIRYRIGTIAGLPDSAVAIPITAVNPLGDSFTDHSLRACRNQTTPPPVHLNSALKNNRTRYSKNDTLVVYTRWSSPAGIDFSIEADYRAIFPAFEPSKAEVREISPDSFEVSYILPVVGLAPDTVGIPVVIRARDARCSVVADSTLRIELDTTPPRQPPVLDPLPSETTETTITVSGTAQDAAWVSVSVNGAPQGPFAVDPSTWRFSTPIDLASGLNSLISWPEDELGNLGPRTLEKKILVVAGRSINYPTPFRPGDEFIVSDAAGVREASVHLYNLEGTRVADLKRTGNSLEMRLRWEGRDREGDLAQPGYYLLKIRSVGYDGRAREQVLPMLFMND